MALLCVVLVGSGNMVDTAYALEAEGATNSAPTTNSPIYYYDLVTTPDNASPTETPTSTPVPTDSVPVSGEEVEEATEADEKIILYVPYYEQGSNGWCAPTSLSMYLRFYGREAKPWQIATDWGLGPREGPDATGFAAMVEDYLANRADTQDLTFLDWGVVGILNFAQYRTSIDSGLPVYVAGIDGTGFLRPSDGGHAVLVVGYAIESDVKYLYIHDPSGAWTNTEWGLDENAFAKVRWDDFFATLNHYENLFYGGLDVFSIGAPYQGDYPSATLYFKNSEAELAPVHQIGPDYEANVSFQLIDKAK
jgi:hypothetical protein